MLSRGQRLGHAGILPLNYACTYVAILQRLTIFAFTPVQNKLQNPFAEFRSNALSLCWSRDLCAGCCAAFESIWRRIIMTNGPL